MRSTLSVCLFLYSEALAQTVMQLLSSDRYSVVSFQSDADFFQFIEKEKQQLDCLILQEDAALPGLLSWLQEHSTFLPVVILSPEIGETDEPLNNKQLIQALETDQPVAAKVPPGFIQLYHPAEVKVSIDKVEHIVGYINQAIAQFLNLSPNPRSDRALGVNLSDPATQNFLMLQQRRLGEKLKERLGYLGVYYKRNPRNFFRHMPDVERQELLDQLKQDYRQIVVNYFSQDSTLNQRIDEFVNVAFFTDISVSQIVEIHMELMDEFSKQLELEGRSEDVLLDYRLTLIDTIAHLCEMYRRSIPRES